MADEARHMRGPTRTCAGCGAREVTPHGSALLALAIGGKAPLVRLVLSPEGGVAVDLAGGTFGRGAHVHASPACIAKACKGGLSRSFKGKIVASPEALTAQILQAVRARVERLLGGAVRAGVAVLGADATKEALAKGAPLCVVAADAGGIARSFEIERAVSEGKAMVLWDKAILGNLFGREEIAVLAVLGDVVAAELKSARLLEDTLRGQRAG